MLQVFYCQKSCQNVGRNFQSNNKLIGLLQVVRHEGNISQIKTSSSIMIFRLLNAPQSAVKVPLIDSAITLISWATLRFAEINGQWA